MEIPQTLKCPVCGGEEFEHGYLRSFDIVFVSQKGFMASLKAGLKMMRNAQIDRGGLHLKASMCINCKYILLFWDYPKSPFA